MDETNSVQAVLKQGVALLHRGMFAEAGALYRQVLGEQPEHFDALHLLGVSSIQSGDSLGGLEWFDKALRVNAGVAMLHFNRGVALQNLQRTEEALASYERAISLRPDYAEAYLNRGIALKELLRWEAALDSFGRVLSINPQHVGALIGCSEVRRRLGDFDSAFVNCEQAIKIAPSSAEAYCELALLQNDLNRWEDAVASCDRAISFKPQWAEVHCNRGNLLYQMNRPHDAIASYDTALALKPDFKLARASRAYALLLAGDYQRGWPEFASRWSNDYRETTAGRLTFQQPRWSGGQPLQGKSILLCADQGFGDTIQFCRYVPLVAALGARVFVRVPKPLFSLMHTLEGVSQVSIEGEHLPPFDFYCDFPTLPAAFCTDVSTIPADIPYLHSDPARRVYWNSKLGPRTKRRVGLVWSGGFRPQHPELWTVNRRRNISLAKLAGWKHADIDFFSLQKGTHAEAELTDLTERGWDGPDIIDHVEDLDDFADTAALIDQLDLVISVDTSTAHLAAALGKPVWLLNRFDTCWRWMLDRTDSPWYPTVRLYRQDQPGVWEGVVEQIRQDLKSWAAS
jgi:tetratricopeptide (TPR) repeat protein